jgi:CHASE2 domain-containing sensor protein
MAHTINNKKLTFWQYFKNRDTIFATLSVFLVMGLLALIPINTHFLDPVKLALNDFEYTDLAYSKMGKNKNSFIDTNIIVVDIGHLNRRQIAETIKKVKLAQAKVIGVDILFEKPKDSVADLELKTLFNENKNIVMSYRLNTDVKFDAQQGYFYTYAKNKGFVNFVAENVGVIRNFQPFIKVEGKTYSSFTSAIVKEYNAELYQKLESRNKKIETINYNRLDNKYLMVSASKVIDDTTNMEAFKNKIVLIGFVSKVANDIEDKHYTPLNLVSAGKGLPDMNGVYIHANVLSMVISGAYISKVPSWINWLIAFVVCWFHMAFFIKYSKEGHMWFHLKVKIASIIMSIFFIYIGLWFFNYFDLKLNMTATLVAVLLAIDVLYFYESFAIWLHKKWGFKTIFNHEVH